MVLDIFFEALNYETIEQKKAYDVAGLLGMITVTLPSLSQLFKSNCLQALCLLFLSTCISFLILLVANRSSFVIMSHWSSFFSGDIGGQMGLFIGASILTVLEILDYIYEVQCLCKPSLNHSVRSE